jgi:hypothetical protein
MCTVRCPRGWREKWVLVSISLPWQHHADVSGKSSTHSWGVGRFPTGKRGSAHGFFRYRNGERVSGTEEVLKALGNAGTKDGIVYQKYEALQGTKNRVVYQKCEEFSCTLHLGKLHHFVSSVVNVDTF